MSELGMTFDPSQVKDDRDLIPENTEVAAQVIEADVVNAKSGNGLVLNLTYEVTEGQYVKRRVWERVNIAHENQQAQEIGQRHLKRLCEAMGLGPITTTEPLLFKPFRGKVGIEQGTGGFDDKNKFKSFKPYAAGGNVSNFQPRPQPEAQSNAGPAEPQQAAVGGGARPWQR